MLLALLLLISHEISGIKERARSVSDDNKHNSCPNQLIKTVSLESKAPVSCFRDRNFSASLFFLLSSSSSSSELVLSRSLLHPSFGMIFLHDYSNLVNISECDVTRAKQWDWWRFVYIISTVFIAHPVNYISVNGNFNVCFCVYENVERQKKKERSRKGVKEYALLFDEWAVSEAAWYELKYKNVVKPHQAYFMICVRM